MSNRCYITLLINKKGYCGTRSALILCFIFCRIVYLRHKILVYFFYCIAYGLLWILWKRKLTDDILVQIVTQKLSARRPSITGVNTIKWATRPDFKSIILSLLFTFSFAFWSIQLLFTFWAKWLLSLFWRKQVSHYWNSVFIALFQCSTMCVSSKSFHNTILLVRNFRFINSSNFPVFWLRHP